MCGILGIVSKESQDPGVIESLTSTLSHRGPDAQDVFLSEDRKVALGHTRLSILDLSPEANQPMNSSTGRYTITYNGEIYNYQEIAKDLLSQKGITGLRTTCDTEVILESYGVFGDSFVNRLNGMFTMAIYDHKENSLMLTRDRVGIKPLYYYQDQHKFIFASELKTITSYPGIKDQLTLNHTAVHGFLHLGYVPQPHTIWNEVKKFPSATIGKIDANLQLKLEPYWKVDLENSDLQIDSLPEAKEHLQQLISSSVNFRMISDVPLGTFLSGGIDSSLVTAVASTSSDQKVNTFNIGFKESQFDESDYARKVAKHLGTQHTEFTLSEKDGIGLVEEIAETFDEPFADSSSISTMLVSRLAREHVKVILTGDGGDELFYGYGSYRWARRFGHPMMKILRRPSISLMRQGTERFKRVADLLDYENPETLPSHIFSQEQYYHREQEIEQLIRTEPTSDLKTINQPFVGSKSRSIENQALFDLNYYLRDDLLVKVDRSSMKYGLECRVPLLDHRIVEYSMRLATSLKVRNACGKYILKEILYDLVPREYFERPKWGFGVPLSRWLSQELSYLISDHLNSNNVESLNLVNYEVVENMINQFRKGHTRYYNRIWQLIILHQWAGKNL